MDEEMASVDGRSEGSIFPSPAKEVPWLVIPYGKSGTPKKQAFYNIMCDPKIDRRRACRKKSIPEFIAKAFWQKPSHQGWLIMLCDDENYDYSPADYKFGDCFLLNPSTLQTICLPSLSPWLGISTGYYLVDCVLSSAPGGGDDSIVLFVFSDVPEGECSLLFLYCLLGDKNWRTEKWCSEAILAEDISIHYFKGRFYLMCTTDQILEISTFRDYDDSSSTPGIFIETYKVIGISSHPLVRGFETLSIKYNFVQTSDQLYCIPIIYTLRGYGKVVIQIAVMKLDFALMAWRTVDDIGDNVLFISSGRFTTACCSAAEMGLARGCLYFTLPRDSCLYKFDIQSSGNSVAMPFSKLRNTWDSDFIMIPNTKAERRGEEHLVPGEEVALPPALLPCSSAATRDAHIPAVLMFSRDHSCPKINFVNPMHDNHKGLLVLPDLVRTVIRFQKGGWLLVSMENFPYRLFFCNPLTGKTIKLPDLPVYFAPSTVAFSSLPTSSDCVVFVIEQDALSQVRIYFIRKGDEDWSCSVFANTNTDRYMPSHNTPVFYNGVFCCVDYNGTLGVFDTKNSVWKVHKQPLQAFDDAVYPSFLVESDGELLLVKMGPLGAFYDVFKLDLLLMIWAIIKDLGKHMLFVSHTSCFTANAPPNSLMANKVYFPRLCMDGVGGVLFYCLKTGKYGSFGSRHSASDFTDTEGWYSNCTWIQPNLTMCTEQELDWVRCPS